jgi:very-short-patch-repair endonuclease
MFKRGESGFKGRTHSPEARAKVSASLHKRMKKGVQPEWLKPHSFPKGHSDLVGPEGHLKRSRSNTGKKRTPEAKAVMREKHIAAMKAGKYGKNADTYIEKILEQELLKRQIAFQKQVPLCGVALADFYIPEFNIVIEADGDYWHSLPNRKARDEARDATLKENGITVVRLSETALSLSAAFCGARVLDEIHSA